MNNFNEKFYKANVVIRLADTYDAEVMINGILSNCSDRKSMIGDLADIDEFPMYCSLWELEVFDKYQITESDIIVNIGNLND